jgi:hypothetical protein
MKRMVGLQDLQRLHPDRYYNHDAEDPDGIVHLGKTEHGEPVNINRRAVESDLVIYVNINLVPMDGGHKSVTVGLCDYESLRPHHEPETIRQSDSYMDPARSALNTKVERMGKIVAQHMNVFHIETALNNRMFHSSTAFLSKNEDEFTEIDRLKFEAMRWTLSKMPAAAKRQLFHSIPAQYQLVSCHAGKTDPVHQRIVAKNFEQYAVSLRGQSDILICGVPVHLALQREQHPQPAAGAGDGARLLPQLLPGQARAAEGRGAHPLPTPATTASITSTTPATSSSSTASCPRPATRWCCGTSTRRSSPRTPSYIEMYRRGNAYHGAHPFFMWYWGENGRQHVGKVIVAGAENAHVPARLGWERAESLTEAIAMARSFTGPSSSITMMHHPPIVMADVD